MVPASGHSRAEADPAWIRCKEEPDHRAQPRGNRSGRRLLKEQAPEVEKPVPELQTEKPAPELQTPAVLIPYSYRTFRRLYSSHRYCSGFASAMHRLCIRHASAPGHFHMELPQNIFRSTPSSRIIPIFPPQSAAKFLLTQMSPPPELRYFPRSPPRSSCRHRYRRHSKRERPRSARFPRVRPAVPAADRRSTDRKFLSGPP